MTLIGRVVNRKDRKINGNLQARRLLIWKLGLGVCVWGVCLLLLVIGMFVVLEEKAAVLYIESLLKLS